MCSGCSINLNPDLRKNDHIDELCHLCQKFQDALISTIETHTAKLTKVQATLDKDILVD